MDNIIKPNYHLKPELISELAISFLENRNRVEQVIKQGYFLYYFIRACKNQVHSNTSPFHKNNRLQENIYYDNMEFVDDSDIELIEEMEEKFKRIDKAYVKIPKTHFQDILWGEYFTKGKTLREIGKEYEISHCLVFHEIKKIKEQMKKII
jgi:hypothetical protein